MRIAVTGASGHIGNCLVHKLINKNHHVKVLIHKFESDLNQLNIEKVMGNILDPESLKKLCKNVDIVFHTAAKIALNNRESEQVFAINIEGTRNIIEASKSAGIQKLIHFSSTDAFEKISPEYVLDEDVPLIKSTVMAYGFSKAESERLVTKAAQNGLDAVILSPSAVVGPFDNRGSFLGNALIKIYQNKLPMLIPGGYNWVDVRDIADAAIQSIEKGRKGEKYILSGAYLSLKELSALVSEISTQKTPSLIAPVFLAKIACPFFQIKSSITGEKPTYTCQSLKIIENAPKNISNQKAKDVLGYDVRPLKQTLIDTFDWYKQNKFLK